jgi:hypothetical protein
MKIHIVLKYPNLEDLESFGLPIPEFFKMKNVVVLAFPDWDAYYRYAAKICELIDELEAKRFVKYSHEKMDKLKFCQHYLELLKNAALNSL